jgi:hypothetical protein
MSMILWRPARIEDALARRGSLEFFPVPFFRVLISSDKGYFVSRNREGRIESEELDGPIFAENDANKLVDALQNQRWISNLQEGSGWKNKRGLRRLDF